MILSGSRREAGWNGHGKVNDRFSISFALATACALDGVMETSKQAQPLTAYYFLLLAARFGFRTITSTGTVHPGSLVFT